MKSITVLFIYILISLSTVVKAQIIQAVVLQASLL